jgi:hypothetical protein
MNVRFIYRIYSGVHRQQKEWDRWNTNRVLPDKRRFERRKPKDARIRWVIVWIHYRSIPSDRTILQSEEIYFRYWQSTGWIFAWRTPSYIWTSLPDEGWSSREEQFRTAFSAKGTIFITNTFSGNPTELGKDLPTMAFTPELVTGFG